MRSASLLLLLAACSDGSIKVEDDTGTEDTQPVAGDEDGDGHAALDAGGDDCDDTNSAIFPGAAETWYDGVDQDCSGGSDDDQDGDGEDVVPIGADCDDADAAVNTAAVEVQDGLDQDCDGVADEDWLVAGSVVVSEIMHHPLAASDADGEWIELLNTTSADIDLQGWMVTADDGDAITIEGSLVVPAGGRVVLGASDNTGLNGGVSVDYAYDRASLSLSADDTLFLQAGGGTIFDMEWSSAWGSVDGKSLSLDPDHASVTDARQAGFWCAASSALGSGDYGTPGAANDDCTALDEDGDGYSVDSGDCNDDDGGVSPAKSDTWDGVDNDCSGAADDGDIGDVAMGYVDGSSASSYLGVFAGVGLGDVTGDGVADMMVGSVFGASYAGALYVVDGTDLAGLSDDVSDVAIATVTGSGYYAYMGATSPAAGDVDGDGVADLVVGSGSGSTYGGGGGSSSSQAVAIFSGGAGIAGDLAAEDADIVISGDTTYSYTGNNSVLTSLDLNGDGLDDVVYGRPNESGSSSGSAKGSVAVFDSAMLGGDVSVDDADMTLGGDSNSDYLGIGLGGADVDGDGYDDLYVGATGRDDYADDGGCWYQVHGGAAWTSSADIDAIESKSLYGATADAGVGFGSPVIADLNRDGLLDMAFGGMETDAVYVFYDLATVPGNVDSSDADLEIAGSDSFGFAVASGDLDGDGGTDLLVGAPSANLMYSQPVYWYYTAGTGRGTVYAFDGAALGTGSTDTTAAWASVVGEDSGDLFGSLMSAMADTNGDGADDVLVGAPRQGMGMLGRVYTLRGK